MDLVSLYFRLLWYHSISRGSIDQIENKTVKSTQPSLVLIVSMTSWSFQTVRRMREAWKRETYVPSQSFSSESAVKYLHVGQRKIQISPRLGQQDQSNALPQGQQRQSNPHPIPLPRQLYIDRCITLGYFLRTPDNSNLFQFPLKVRVIASRLYNIDRNRRSSEP